MKRLYLLLFWCLSISSFAQTIVEQDFDANTTWGYTSDVTYFSHQGSNTVNNVYPASDGWSGDGFYGIIDLTDATGLDFSNLSGNLLGEKDLDDEGDFGTSGDATTTFDDVDVSSYTGVEISFDFDVEGYNANSDEAFYEVFHDGVGQGRVTLQTGSTPGDDAEGAITVSVPDAVSTLALEIIIQNNGSDGFSGFDNFQVTGTLSSAPLVGFDASTSSENEGSSGVNIPVTLSNYSSDVDLNVSVTGGTAEGGDYTLNTTSLSFTGNGTQNISIDINQDADIEDETIEITLTESTSTGITISPDVYILTAIDDDANTCDSPVWDIVPVTLNGEGDNWQESSGEYSVNAFTGSADPSDLWLVYGPVDMSSTSILKLGFDLAEDFDGSTLNFQYTESYTGNPGDAGNNWISVQTLSDAATGASVDFGAATGANTFLGIQYTATGEGGGTSGFTLSNISLVADACPPAAQSVGFDEASSDGNEGSSLSIPVSLESYAGSPVDLSVTVSGGTAAMADYTLNTSTLSFTADGTQNISIDLNDDADTDSETIELTIAETTSTGIILTQPIHTITISDDDLPEIIITELMQNPSAVSDSNGEYFEIYNNGSDVVNLDGWVISDNGSDSHTIDNSGSLEIEPGGYLVLGNNDDVTSNGGIIVNYSYGSSWFLSNGGDEIVLTDASANEIDRVEYDGGSIFPDPNGASMSLTDVSLDNNDGSNWVEASTNTYGDGDAGTPGLANDFTGIIWNGASDNDWGTAANWSTGVPGSSDEAGIPMGASVIVSDDQSVDNVFIEADASLTVQSGASLAIFGSATGQATIERNAIGNAAYSIIGSPVSNAEVSDLGAQFIFDYDGSGFVKPSGTLTPGKGYFVAYSAAMAVVSLTGTPNTGVVNYTLNTAGDGFNMIANPYAAAVDYSAFIGANSGSTTGVLYFWDDGGSNVGSDRGGDYIAVTGLGSANVQDQGDGVGGTKGNVFNDNIGSLQGFFMEATGAGTITFDPAMQSTTAGDNSDVAYFREAEVNDYQAVKLALKGEGFYNEVIVGLIDGATLEADFALDAKKFKGSTDFAFYSRQGQEAYAIQALPERFGETMSVPLGIDAEIKGEYTLQKIESNNLASDIEVTILDVATGNSYNLRDFEVLDFSIEEALNNEERFELIFNRVEDIQVITSTDVSTEALTVKGDKTGLHIGYSESPAAQVSVYTLSGRLMVDQEVNFIDNRAFVKATLLRNQVYILNVNGTTVKFTLQ